MDQLEIRLLGRFSARRGGREVPAAASGGRLVRSLIRMLVVRRGSFLSKDTLVEALWGDRPPMDPVANLEVLISRARRSLGDPAAILTGPGGYSFSDGDGIWVDIEAFRRWSERGSAALSGGDSERALGAFAAAIELWGGEPLPEDAYSEWAQEPRRELSRAYVAALEGGAQAALAAGEPSRAVTFADRATAADPLRESANLLLIRALAEVGDHASAVATFESFRARLADELGLDPSPVARDVHLRLLRGQLADVGNRAIPNDRVEPVDVQVRTAFVGRDAELRILLAAGRGGVVLVAGRSGSGKTRLLAEAGHRSPVAVIEANAFLPEREDAWALARSIVREALSVDPAIGDSIPPSAAGAVASLVSDSIGSVQPSPLGEARTGRRLLREGIVGVLAALARTGVLVLLDDVQWADGSTLEAIHLAAERLPTMGLVVAYRPEEVGRDDHVASFLRRLRSAERVDLGPLGAGAIAEVAQDPRLARALVEGTDSMPQTVTQALAGLAERGLAMPDAAGRWIASRTFAPSSARAAVSAGQRAVVRRLAERQSPTRRETLAVVALIGREIPARVVASIRRSAERQVLEDLDGLARGGLVRLGDQGWAPAHDSIGEALVESMDPSTRAALHARIAAALGADGDDAEAGRHLAGAGDPTAAATALGRGAADRLTRHANAEAERLADEAIALADPTVELLVTRAECRQRRGALEAGRDDLRRAAAMSGPGPIRAGVTVRLAMLEAGAEDYELARSLVEVARLDAMGDERVSAEALAARARIGLNLGELEASEAWATEAIGRFERLGDATEVLGMLHTRAVLVFAAGRIREALPMFERVVLLARDLGDLFRTVFPECYRAMCLVHLARPAEASACADMAIDTARLLGWRDGEVFALLHRGAAMTDLDRPVEAAEALRLALDLAETGSHREWTTIARRFLGILALRTGDDAGALEHLRAAVETADGMPIHAAVGCAHLAIATARVGNVGEAGRLVDRAFAEAERGWPYTLHEVRLAAVEVAAARGDPWASRMAAEALAEAERDGFLSLVPRIEPFVHR